MSTAVRDIGPVSNDGAEDLSAQRPIAAHFRLRGTSDLLFHRWSNEAVAEKAGALKNSKAKKTDNLPSYVWRLDNGNLALPGEYVLRSVIQAARFRQDPRSPRKSAKDLAEAAIISLTPLADLGTPDWDYELAARVTVQRQGVTRVRPAMRAGWQAEFVFVSLLPNYISLDMLQSLLVSAGYLVGVGDHRPTYGRFAVAHFEQTRVEPDMAW